VELHVRLINLNRQYPDLPRPGRDTDRISRPAMSKRWNPSLDKHDCRVCEGWRTRPLGDAATVHNDHTDPIRSHLPTEQRGLRSPSAYPATTGTRRQDRAIVLFRQIQPVWCLSLVMDPSWRNVRWAAGAVAELLTRTSG
jgi:hypothetical protein